MGIACRNISVTSKPETSTGAIGELENSTGIPGELYRSTSVTSRLETRNAILFTQGKNPIMFHMFGECGF